MVEVLEGYKTYIIGLIAIITGLYMISQGMQADGMQLILLGMGLMGLRRGIEKK